MLIFFLVVMLLVWVVGGSLALMSAMPRDPKYGGPLLQFTVGCCYMMARTGILIPVAIVILLLAFIIGIIASKLKGRK